MASPALIGPQPPGTPSGPTWGRRRRSLPPDLLRAASRRLGAFGLIAAALWTVATLAGHIASDVMSDGRYPWSNFTATDVIALVGALVSIALFAYTRRSRRDPRRVLDVGLAYMVVTALLLGVMFHWDPAPPDAMIYPQISWIGATILMFAALVPNAPWKTFLAAFLSAAMGPLGMLTAYLRGSWHTSSPVELTLLMHYPDFLLVGVAVVIAGVQTRLGEQVTRAREMGSYHLGEIIGKGGMGEVYRATHRMLARPAAIKLIRPETLGPPGSDAREITIKRFRREAEVAASLRSPHTVEIYDFGETEEGTLYFVMELLDGMDLETLVRAHGPLPAARVVHLLRQACESLEEAHSVGLVHRDVKPANIFVGRQGILHDFVKVLDFGLVKPMFSPGHEPTLATAEGLTPGTPAYMAPEMALGETIEGRVDIYALGCVAYFLLTGRLVFEAENALQMIARHLQAEPVPPSRRADRPVPESLDRFVIACLAKTPSARPDAVECRRWLARIGEPEWGEEQAVEWWRAHEQAASSPLSVALPLR